MSRSTGFQVRRDKLRFLGAQGDRRLTILFLTLSLALPIVAQQTPSPSPLHFDVASIKPMPPNPEFLTMAISGAGERKLPFGPAPGTGVFLQASLLMIIQAACGLQPYQVGGGPDWMNSPDGFFVIEAKADPPATHEQLQQMLQNLLADRFKLQVKTENRNMPGYAVVVAKGGLKNLAPVAPKLDAQGKPAPTLSSMTIAQFTDFILHPGPDGYSVPARRSMPVEDRTGLTDNYDFVSALGHTLLSPTNPPDGYHPDGVLPQTLSDYLSDKLGLKLVKTTLPRTFLTILQVEKPTPN